MEDVMLRVPVTVTILIVQLMMLLLGATPALAGDGAAITGTAYHDVDGDGWASPGEPGIANATVYVRLSTGATVTTQTDAAGNFIVHGLGMGSYDVWAEDGESNESAMRPVEIGEVNAAVAIELPFEYDLSDDVVMQSASMIFLPAITR
ncbi:MAG: hypothetical protein KIT77_03825 [Caldilinea sp.]|nr:hypothetical protein [Caldilineaceae bacterium]MCB9120665.1 hypothetical protein [Caldilineaceae bacterium]MCW5840351.1 hypothetical protein [Caldilinea sp.]